mmetsp:Transcript_49667/g.130650  ORF Transcript_49667/g.130650 Transcript_49667/m.130650 type:complete len:170 (+) Transcript_49667:407-916(+)
MPPIRPTSRPTIVSTSAISLDARFTQLQHQTSLNRQNLVAARRFGTVPRGGGYVRGRGAAIITRGRGGGRGGFITRGTGRGGLRGGFVPRGTVRGRNIAGRGVVRGTRGRGNGRGGRGGRGRGRGGKAPTTDDLDVGMDEYMGRDPEVGKHEKLDSAMDAYWTGNGGNP